MALDDANVSIQKFTLDTKSSNELDHALEELQRLQADVQMWKDKYYRERDHKRELSKLFLSVLNNSESDSQISTPTKVNLFSFIDSLLSPNKELEQPFAQSSHIPRHQLSPTLASFDFDDDDDDESSDDCELFHSTIDRIDSKELLQYSEESRTASTESNKQESTNYPEKITQLNLISNRSNRAFTAPPSMQFKLPMSSLDASGDKSKEKNNRTSLPAPSPTILYRILYSKTKPSVSAIWQTHAQNTKKFHHVAKSVLFAMYLKQERIYEHFYIAGISPTMQLIHEGEKEEDCYITKSMNEAVKDGEDCTRDSFDIKKSSSYYRPALFYEFPRPPNGFRDATIASFCFPNGVPVIMCDKDQEKILIGSVISAWSNDANELCRRVTTDNCSNGYTFRLTGAKGEVLYGICVSVLVPLDSNCTTMKFDRTHGVSVLSPIAYCFTSKFPFFHLHFSMLRLVIERELSQIYQSKHEPAKDIAKQLLSESESEIEFVLQSHEQLGVQFKISRQIFSMDSCCQPQTVSRQHNLESIASRFPLPNADCEVIMSEDTCERMAVEDELNKLGGYQRHDECTKEMPKKTWKDKTKAKSHSVDETLNGMPLQTCLNFRKNHPMVYSPNKIKTTTQPTEEHPKYTIPSHKCFRNADGWVELPQIAHINRNGENRTLDDTKLIETLKIGDQLVSIEGIHTASLGFAQSIYQLEHSPRPLSLRFQRHGQHNTDVPTHYLQISGDTKDLLYRARMLKLSDPGHWSSTRFPQFHFRYQFPQHHPERYCCSVALQLLEPEAIVQMLALLLLEKQVVVMSNSPSKTSAICTALLLLLGPYEWQSTYIPLLPITLLDFLHSPVPFLVGAPRLLTPEEIQEWPDVCFLNVDHPKDISIPRMTSHFNQTSLPNGIELCRLYGLAKGQLDDLFDTGVKSSPWHELSYKEHEIITETMEKSALYLKCICGNLEELDLTAVTENSFYERLQEEIFKRIRSSAFCKYLEEFTQTQLFCEYAESVLHDVTKY